MFGLGAYHSKSTLYRLFLGSSCFDPRCPLRQNVENVFWYTTSVGAQCTGPAKKSAEIDELHAWP